MQIREFRHRHWNFVKEYILKHTTHPVATGGSPIITWLPNQLDGVLEAMGRAAAVVARAKDRLSPEHWRQFQELEKRFDAQQRHLRREVDELARQRSRESVVPDAFAPGATASA